MKKLLILFLLTPFFPSYIVDRIQSCELRDIRGLKAFSMAAAKKAIESGSMNQAEIVSVGFITKVWGVLLDTNEELIVVGDSDPTIPPLLLDDVAVALRTIDNINTGENPGVSIEPFSIDEYGTFQKVVYYGGIDSTNYGRICYETDLLLKRLALGFEKTGIVGFPSEWDLSIDNAKSSRRLNPWERSVGRSWFFPMRVRIALRNECAAVTSMTMEVRTDLDEALEIPREFIPLDTKTLTGTLKANREAVSVIFARLFTQHYEEISAHFPVLIQLKNLLALSGLLSELLKEDVAMKDFNYWANEFPVKSTNNPPKVPTLSRGVNGLGYSHFMSGGLSVEYIAKDAWTDAVISRKPKYLKEAVLKSRPSPSAVSWVIPLNQGRPHEWTDSLLATINLAPNALGTIGESTSNRPAVTAGTSLQNLTPSWHPATQGDNLIGLKASLYFSSGGFETFSPEGRFSVAGAEVSTGIPIGLQLIFKNRFELSLTIPLVFRMEFQDRPARLPGIKENLFAYAAGIENPILANRIQLFTGVKNGRWLLPSIVVENSIVIPEKNKVLETSEEAESGQLFRARFGTDDWHGAHALRMTIPVKRGFSVSAFSEFQTDWSGSLIGDRIVTGGATRWQFEKDVGLSLGLHYKTSVVRQENSLFPFGQTPISWVSEGHQFFLSLSFPTRSGVNSMFLGWYAPPRNRPDLGGTFLMSIDLSGTSLLDRRIWF